MPLWLAILTLIAFVTGLFMSFAFILSGRLSSINNDNDESASLAAKQGECR